MFLSGLHHIQTFHDTSGCKLTLTYQVLDLLTDPDYDKLAPFLTNYRPHLTSEHEEENQQKEHFKIFFQHFHLKILL